MRDLDELKERTSISLDPDLFAKGRERARKARRDFSNYIEVLIEADVAGLNPSVQHPEAETNGNSLRAKSVRLSQEQIEALERRAEEDKRDISQVIRIALDEFFERLKRKAASR